MDADSLVTTLVRLQLAASAAILLVLLLRPLALRWCGAGTAYLLWLVVPVAAVAVLLPAREQVVVIPAAPDVPFLQQHVEPDLIVGVAGEDDTAAPAVRPDVPDYRPGSGSLIALWLLGAGLFLARSIVNTRRLSSSASLGPALVGVLRPRLVLPPDFGMRFSAQERALILAHEERHRASRHTLVNALVEIVRCAGWFNPLLHWAARRFRADQELACDTAVIAAHPQARRTYAEALLKAQGAGVYLPMGCVWNSGTAGRLGERIARLSEQLPGRRRRLAGAASIVGIGIAACYAAWAQQPARIITVQQANPERAPAPQSPAPTPTAQGARGAPLPGPSRIPVGNSPGSAAAEREPDTSESNGEPALYDAEQLRTMSTSPLGAIRPGGPYTTEDAILDYAVAHQDKWLNDAQYRTLVLARARTKFERDFPGVVQELGLAEDVAQRLFAALTETTIATMAKLSVVVRQIPMVLGRPTPAEEIEMRASERRILDLQRESRRGQDEAIQDVLGDKFAQWQAYRDRTLRIRAYEDSREIEERLRSNQATARPLSVTADRPQREAHRRSLEALERITEQNKKMRMELERDGLLDPLPQE